MRAILTCCWPGLTRLWNRGELSGLATAALFAALLNLAILAKFVWPELLSAKLASAIWVLVGVFWLAGFLRSLGNSSQQRPGSLDQDEQEAFQQAQTEYLRGHWFEAEALVRELLLANPRDLDAHLMLASLLRQTERWQECSRELEALERLEGSDKWWLEIQQERSRLKQAQAESQQETAPQPADELPHDGEDDTESDDWQPHPSNSFPDSHPPSPTNHRDEPAADESEPTDEASGGLKERRDAA